MRVKCESTHDVSERQLEVVFSAGLLDQASAAIGEYNEGVLGGLQFIRKDLEWTKFIRADRRKFNRGAGWGFA